MKSRTFFARLLLGTALATGPVAAAHAQTAARAPAAEAGTDADEDKDTRAASTGNEIIVTGSATEQRKFDVSYAVTALSNDDIQKLAPLNFADLLGNIPGIHAEATGGEVQNVYRLRGIPNEGSFQAFHQDGLPIYHDNDGPFFKGDVLNRVDLMTQTVEFVRGGPAPIFASNASAIYNAITVTGSETPAGAVRVTLGDTGLYRLDAYHSGPIGERTYFAAGGFIRRHDGYRPNGFPSDDGGQFRANIRHAFDTGEVKLSVLYLNDKNVFYLPIPVADPRNPSVSLDRFLDYFEGTLNTPALRNARLLYSNGAGGTTVEDRDLADGRHTKMYSIGLEYRQEIGDWTFDAKGRFTDGRVDFDALYSTTNPVDSTVFANSFLTAARAAFNTPTATVARLGYAIGGTGGATVFDPTATSGLVLSAQYRAISSDFYSGQGELRLSREFETGLGKHSVVFGGYAAAYGNEYSQRYQDYLFELATKPRTLDLLAYSATGQVLGSVTDKGVLRYSTTLTAGESDVTMWAVFANDTWQVTDNLRIDAGIRHERYVFKGCGIGQTTVNLGDPTTLADNATRAYTGVPTNRRFTEDVTPWTVGANYDISQSFGVYARVAEAFRVPSEFNVYSGAANVTPKARQYELGVKIALPGVSAYLTGFYTKFDPFNASFLAFNPNTGQNNVPLTFIGSAVTKGVEADIDIRPVRWLSLAGTVTVSDPTISDLVNEFGASAAAVDGNQLIRQPKIYGNFRPTVFFNLGDLQVQTYLRYNYTGKRFVDLFNLTELPAYDTLGAGIVADYANWSFQIVGDNITNARGLTEGNPRTDQLAGQGASQAIYGRPLFGRNVRFVVTRKW
ncbi:TonB-dependent receptor [Blastomonas sp. UPD001]|jgi:iron complex outermembrane recepter protein|uniref:TonB-dependent receptor n=1 Tax=Blastomonas sp. UPD001 TaxID=2217673 RepID=UPI001E289798|nr:TonB-dependent receptor [Blastomonas sp. UPD001]